MYRQQDFPEKIQFWTRVGNDKLQLQNLNGRRIDLEFPHLFWDNKKDQNVIVVPDPYMHAPQDFARRMDKISMMTSANFNSWDEKLPIAVFRGATTGDLLDNDGSFSGRLKLVIESEQHSDLLDAKFSKIVDNRDWVNQYLQD